MPKKIDTSTAMKKVSAGILLYRCVSNQIEVLLIYPGGPYFAGKDIGSWSIPKGVVDSGEDMFVAAKREFVEELGLTPSFEHTFPLNPIQQKGGKTVYAWAVECDLDIAGFMSNRFSMEYPYKSGRWIEIAEVDKAEWFDTATAMNKINPAQVALIRELLQVLPEK